MSHPRRLAVLGLIALILTTTGCGTGPDMQPTITIAQAIDQVNTLVQEAFAQLPPGAQLQATGPTDNVPCKGGAGGTETGQVFTERKYEIMHPDTWPADQLIDILDRYWQTRGYTLVRDNRDDPVLAVLYRRDPHNTISVGVKLYPRGGGRIDAYLVGSTPCVWENGTPPG